LEKKSIDARRMPVYVVAEQKFLGRPIWIDESQLHTQQKKYLARNQYNGIRVDYFIIIFTKRIHLKSCPQPYMQTCIC